MGILTPNILHRTLHIYSLLPKRYYYYNYASIKMMKALLTIGFVLALLCVTSTTPQPLFFSAIFPQPEVEYEYYDDYDYRRSDSRVRDDGAPSEPKRKRIIDLIFEKFRG